VARHSPQNDRLPIIKLLLQRGANIEAKDNQGVPPLILARAGTKTDIMEVLRTLQIASSLGRFRLVHS